MEKDEPNIINVNNEDDKFIKNDNQIQIQNNNNAKRTIPSNPGKTTNLNSLIMNCAKNEEYCYSMLDYLKKIYHLSQIDYYSAYIQMLYCFKPKEL